MTDQNLTTKSESKGFFRRVFRFYIEGFRGMSRTSRVLWIIILVKLFIMFAVLKLFFFPNVVKQSGDKERQIEYVVDELTKEEYKEGRIPMWYDQSKKKKESRN